MITAPSFAIPRGLGIYFGSATPFGEPRNHRNHRKRSRLGVKGGRKARRLLRKMRRFEEKSRKQMKKTKAEIESGSEDLAGELSDKLDRQVSGVLQKMGIPSRAQVQDLTLRVEQLSEQVDRLAAPRPAKKTAAPAKAAKTTKAAAKA